LEPLLRLKLHLDPATLEPLDSANLAVSYKWLGAGLVTLDGAGYPSFPPLPAGPGLYRFDFGIDEEGRRVIYVGEGKSISGRARQYRNAKVDRKRALTSRRIHRAMVDHLVAGRQIAMSVVVTAGFADGSSVDFGKKSGRLLIESAAVVMAQLDGSVRLLNVDHHVIAEIEG
jgi:hypothetical protein